MLKQNFLKSILCLLMGIVCNVAWAQAVIFPQAQQPGTAKVETVSDGYTIGNDLFTAKFVKVNNTLKFGGCDELGLLAGTEIFKVQLGDGTEVPASQFTLGEVVTEALVGNSKAVKAARRYNGQQIKATFTHSSGLAIEWRAVLRDGSHYLRTEMDIKNPGTEGIAMNSITPMMYTVQNVDGEKAPAVVGNTRGAVIASDKIFAGVETPTAYNMAGEATDLEAFVFKAWDGASSWAWTPEESMIPTGIKNLSQYTKDAVNASRGYLIFREIGDYTITLDYISGNNRLQILGVDILDVNGNVVDTDYHFGFTGGSDSNRDYTVTVSEVGAYMVRIFVTNAGNGEGYGSKGSITYSKKVTLPELVYDLASTQTPYVTPEIQEPKTLLEITPEEGTLTASHSKQTQWTSGLSQFSNWTKAIPEGMSAPTASAIYLDKHYAIEAGNLSVVFDYTSGSHGLNLLGVQLIDAKGIVTSDYHVGFTGSSDRNNTYSLVVPSTGDYIVRMFVDKKSDGVDGNGNIDFTLTAFTYDKISIGTGTSDRWTSEWTGFANWTGSLPEGTTATGTAKYIDKKYLIDAGKLSILFDYTSGNHGLYVLGVQVLDINGKVVSKEFKNGFTGSNSTVTYTVTVPKAGLYTVRYITDYRSSDGSNTNGDITFSLAEAEPVVVDVLGTINEDEALADAWKPSDWKTIAADKVPNRVNEAGCTDENARVIEQQITITTAGVLSVEFLYASGNARLNMVGVDLVDETGSVAVDDYHVGYTGNDKNANIYKLNVFAPGTYTIRYFADNSENINSTGNINLKLTVDYTLHLVAAKTTPISGKWSRVTTLKPDETWDISSVVGVIAPGQARRSILCYSERERAVPWRAVPTYVSWYELNINHNNASPGSEHENSQESEYLAIVNAWKEQLYDKYHEAPYAFVWDDGWDKYGEWQFHSGLPYGFTNIDKVGRQMGAGQGAWLGPVGGYGTSGGYRKNYWNSTKTGGMQLSNPAYYEVFVNAVTDLLYDYGYDFRFFKFDGISTQFSSVGPDDGAVGNENAEAIILAEKVLRNIKEDVFLNTSVGTWASPFWFQFTDAIWRQEKDYGTIGNNSVDRENWITYRDRLVYQNYVQNSPLCPINTLMTHGFILTGNPNNQNDTGRGGWTAARNIEYKHVLNELRCAFACGSGMVELYNDFDLTNHINNGALWGDIAECIQWQRNNADVLPDIHWVGGNPWTGAKAEVYGWAAWNEQKAVLTLRNGANDAQEFTFTLREVLEIPEYITSSAITFTKAFDDQVALTGFAEGEQLDIDAKITVTVPGSSVYVFDGVDNSFVDDKANSPFSTEQNPEYWWIKFCAGNATLSGPKSDSDAKAVTVEKACDDNQLWMLVGNKDGFYLKNKAGYYLSWNGSRFTVTTQFADKATLLLHESKNAHAEDAGCYEIQLKGGNYLNQNGGAGTGKELGSWNAGDNNNHFVFISSEPGYPIFNDEETWYYIQFKNGGWSIEDMGVDSKVKTAKTDDLTTQRWRVIGTKDECQFVNQEGRYLVYKDSRIQTRVTRDEQGFKLVPTTHNDYAPCLEIQHKGTEGKSFNMHQGAGVGKEIALFDANDGGNPLSFVPAEGVTFPEFRIATSDAAAPTEKLTLWYTQPATATNANDIWMEYSLPIGNGQFGASIFGGVAKEEVQFNEKTLWSGTKNDYSSEYGDYENFGSVYIEDLSGLFTYNPTKPVLNYYRDLNLKNATATVSYEDADGVKYQRQYIASNPDKVVAMHLTASEDAKLNIKVTMAAGRPGLRAETSYAEGTATFGGKLETISYNALAKVLPTGGTMTTDENGITVTDADEVLIILGGATDYDPTNANYVSGTDGLSALVAERVNAAADKTWSTLYDAHVADHKSFFDRCDFVLDGADNTIPTDELIRQYAHRVTGTENFALMLEQLYFAYGRYLEIASSRGVDLPSNLQGIWNNSSEPAWNADIHANINVQMNYWPAEPTNLSELHMPFLNYIINMANSAEWKNLAQQRNGATRSEAWTMLTENNIFGGFGSFQRNALINNAWYVSHLWQHYRYTLDESFLERAFPAMWGATVFWMERLVLNEEDGKYECPNEYSPEHGPNENATAHSQQLVWELFDNTLKAIEILGESKVNADDLATLRNRFANLDKGLAIEQYTPDGDKGKWGEGAITYGSSILREWKTSNYYAGSNGHRHMSHLMCLYPFNQISAGTDLFNAAINSMLLRGDASTGWSMGWKINLWARALDGDHSHDILELALRHHSVSGGGVYYNLYDSHAPFQIDGNFGACAGIAEMLMQSHTEVIDILPALPSVWQKGSITGLKAVGNFTTDIEWKDSKAQLVTITSHKGAPLKVRCNRGAMNIADAFVTVNGTEVAALVDENGIATIPNVKKNDVVVIDFTKRHSVAVKVYIPGERVSTLVPGKKYFIYDTAINGTQDRTGFLVDNGAGMGHTKKKPFGDNLLKTTNEAYLWEVVATGTAGQYYIKAADGGYVSASGKTDNASAQILYIEPWSTSSKKGDANSENVDGTTTANANIGNDVFTIYNGNTCWNGETNSFTTWSDAHPYAFHEVTEDAVMLSDAFPCPGKTYYIYCDNDTRQYFYNDGGTLKVSEKRTEWSNEYLFTCSFDGQYFQFKNMRGKFLAHKGLSDTAHNFELATYLDGVNLKTPGGSYFVMKADGGFDQASKGNYDPASTNFSTVYKFEEFNFPVDGETYYIYSDTYYNNEYVNRYMYADGSNLKLNTSLSTDAAYQWTCTVTEDGKVQFKNGAGKYLAHKGIQDTPYNFTLNKYNANHAIAATLYSVAANRYFVVKSDGTGFDQSTIVETGAYCADFVFMPVNDVRILTVRGSNKSEGATATWNGETKTLPATWVITPQTTITDATLTVNGGENYSFIGLFENGADLGESAELSDFDTSRTITAKLTPTFFSASTDEKDLVPVRIRSARNNTYTLRLNASDSYTGKAVNSGVTAYGENEIWYLVGTDENFKIYNRIAGTGLHVVLAGTGGGSAASMNNTSDNSEFCLIAKDNGYAICPKSNTDQSFNMHGGAGADIKLYGAGDGGSIWTIGKMDVDNPLILNVEVDQVWESSPRVAELTFTIDGVAGQTRILGNVEGKTLYLPAGATYEVSSMTYRGYTYNGCTEENGVLTASYTANDERTLFYSPRDGHPYRIPAIATAPNGDVFAVCDYRPCGNDIGYGEVDLVCRVSSDNGVTWTEERTIADGLGHINDGIWKMGFGDPAIVADRESNKVLVMSVCGNRTCWDGNYGEGGENENPNRISRLYIEHDGEKWVYGQPEEVTYDIYPLFKNEGGEAYAASMFIGAGKICQSRVVKKGEYYRLYCAVWNVTKTQRQHHNYVIYSDDFGKTWNVLGDLGYENSASKWGNEPKVEELPDGTVVLSSRKNYGRYFNLFTFADDTYTTGSWMGEVGSNEVQGGLSFGGNSTNGEIYKVKAIHKESGRICDLMFQSIPTGNDRDNVAIYYKEMEYNEDGTNKYTPTTFAQGWTKGIHVSTKGSCYSTMISQADGRIAFFFEEEPSGFCMVYIPYTIEELTGDAYTLYNVSSTITEYGIGTFYASEAMKIPEGVQAYVATEMPHINGDVNASGYLRLEELEEGIIPAKTGVVLKGEAGTYNFIPSISYGAKVEGNMLVGFEAADNQAKSCAEVTCPTDGSVNYVLAVENEVAAFYRKVEDFMVYNNKAYLNVPTSGVAVIHLDDETTNIDTVDAEAQNAVIYDLSGRRTKKVNKGVYIVNGKKVIR